MGRIRRWTIVAKLSKDPKPIGMSSSDAQNALKLKMKHPGPGLRLVRAHPSAMKLWMEGTGHCWGNPERGLPELPVAAGEDPDGEEEIAYGVGYYGVADAGFVFEEQGVGETGDDADWPLVAVHESEEN